MEVISRFAFVLLAVGVASTAHALQLLQVKSCANCTATQMQTMAKNSMPIGINFVYDLPHHIIRKYEVYMDSSCRPIGGGLKGSAGQQQADRNSDPRAGSSGPGTDCGSFKAADEMTPVDTEVQATFDALYHTYQVNQTLANTGKATRSSPLPIDTVTGQPYDLRYIAFDYPQRSYIRFWADLRSQLSNRDTANALSSGLGDEIFDWSVASVDVGEIFGEEIGVEFGLSWDRSTSTHFTWYVPPWNDRIELDINRSANGTLSFVFDGILDIDDNYYPSANGDSPLNQNNSGFPHHNGDHFDGGMQHGGISTPQMPECGWAMHPFQTISRVSGPHGYIIGVAYSCVPN